MKSVEKAGKTVEEAVQAALQELGAKRQDVEVEVLEEPNKGFLGIIGGKLARVRVTVKASRTEIAVQFLQKTVALMGMQAKIDVKDEGEQITLSLQGPHLGVLIGKHGQTLDALQYLTNLVVNKGYDERLRIILDVEGYRQRREETLRRLALRLAEKVRREGKNITLEPMNPHERRIIHTTLQSDPYVYTFSQGEEPFRKIVISAKR